ncbi:MAG: hypothetical protein ACQGVC_22470 [Myxococcota bacterium]
MDDVLRTPFRDHYEHCRGLDLRRQLHECADHLQHPDVLLMEFFESYHLVERGFSPEHALAPGAAGEELVLEPFYASLQLELQGGTDAPERLVCVSGSMSPVPEDLHPALTRSGLDYVGLRAGEPPRIVLGVSQGAKEETPYVLLLRALNCFAELSPPFRVVQLERELIQGPVTEDVRFDLHIGVTEPSDDEEWVALAELTRDLAELFKRQVEQSAQFSETLGRIECVEIDPAPADGVVALERIWSV